MSPPTNTLTAWGRDEHHVYVEIGYGTQGICLHLIWKVWLLTHGIQLRHVPFTLHHVWHRGRKNNTIWGQSYCYSTCTILCVFLTPYYTYDPVEFLINLLEWVRN